jgi:UDP-glucose 4-epimerase
MKKVVVIGGSGFLGSHVADTLSDNGYKVTIYDSQPSSWIRSDQQLIVGNILDFDNLNQAINGSDVVYNFAALADLNKAINQPLRTAEINILGNVHALEACRLNGIKRFVYGSTVYVNSREGSFYRCSKQAAENYVEEYQKVYGIEYTILRYGSLYGPRSNETNGLFRIVKAAIDSGSIRFVGHPDSMREYIHVADAARASAAALGDEFKNQSVVLTGQEPMQVVDMLKMLAEILGMPDESVEFVDGTYTGHYVRTPYAYQQKLGRKYIPPMHVDLGQGLLELIQEVQTCGKVIFE